MISRSSSQPSANAPNCLRCKTTALVPVESPDSISFYECPKCQRRFARKQDGGFEQHPEQHCEEVAALFAKQETADRIKRIVEETRLELDDPTQQVRDILESHASEEALRRY